ncbi:MAG: LysM peptidoglycan-binding domain-containing protein [Coleofasciculaceae cyanobacterium SM2_1_6]|nr:LysM peptidoglycan-binding domain-containing protein [Coleofasciculaceae cyanobacterium SM2_1_6]
MKPTHTDKTNYLLGGVADTEGQLNSLLEDKANSPEVNRRAYKSAAMLGLAISLGASGVFMPHQGDEAIAVEPLIVSPTVNPANPEQSISSPVNLQVNNLNTSSSLLGNRAVSISNAPLVGIQTSTQTSHPSLEQTSNAQEGPRTESQPQPPVVITPVSSVIYHQVQSGETLWQLAQKYQVSSEAIAQANNIEVKAMIAVGQTLKIPTPSTHEFQLGETGDSHAPTYGVLKTQIQRVASLNSPGVNTVGPANNNSQLQNRQNTALQNLRGERDRLKETLGGWQASNPAVSSPIPTVNPTVNPTIDASSSNNTSTSSSTTARINRSSGWLTNSQATERVDLRLEADSPSGSTTNLSINSANSATNSSTNSNFNVTSRSRTGVGSDDNSVNGDGSTPQVPDQRVNATSQPTRPMIVVDSTRYSQGKSAMVSGINSLNAAAIGTVSASGAESLNNIRANNIEPSVVDRPQPDRINTVPPAPVVVNTGNGRWLNSPANQDSVTSGNKQASGWLGNGAGGQESSRVIAFHPSPDSQSILPSPEPVNEQRRVEVHQVQPGETLDAIARRYGTTRQELIVANRLTNPNRILVDQRITIPNPVSNSIPDSIPPARGNQDNSTLGANPVLPLPVATVASLPQATPGNLFGRVIEDPTPSMNQLNQDELVIQRLRDDIRRMREEYQQQRAAQPLLSNLNPSPSPVLERTTAVNPATVTPQRTERVNPEFQPSVGGQLPQSSPTLTSQIPDSPQLLAAAPTPGANYNPMLQIPIGKWSLPNYRL